MSILTWFAMKASSSEKFIKFMGESPILYIPKGIYGCSGRTLDIRFSHSCMSDCCGFKCGTGLVSRSMLLHPMCVLMSLPYSRNLIRISYRVWGLVEV